MTRRFFTPSSNDLLLLKNALRPAAGGNDEGVAVDENLAQPEAVAAVAAAPATGPAVEDVERAYLTGKLHVLLEESGNAFARSEARGVVGRFQQSPALRRRRTPPNGPIEVNKWLARFPRFAAMTCAIAVPGAHLGSGFLVGPNLVLTSFHVLDQVILNPALAPRVSFIFDQQLGSNGVLSAPTHTSYLADDDWLMTDSESMANPELDFVVVRLKTDPGKNELATGVRSWVDLPREPATIVANLNVVALHRPRPDALMYSPGVVCETTEGPTVQYTLSMLPGSSGSPVFDVGWQLLAIHRRDVEGNEIGPFCTEGVLAHVIAAQIDARGARPDKAPFKLALD